MYSPPKMRKYEDGESNREERDAVADNFHDAREVHLGKGIFLQVCQRDQDECGTYA